MGLFDKLKQATERVARDAVQTASNKSVDVQFAKLPDTLDEFKALPQAQLATPFDTATGSSPRIRATRPEIVGSGFFRSPSGTVCSMRSRFCRTSNRFINMGLCTVSNSPESVFPQARKVAYPPTHCLIISGRLFHTRSDSGA